MGVFVVTVVAWWTEREGGYAPGSWYPGALLSLALLVAAVRVRDVARLPTMARRSLALFSAFVAWSFLSIAWADARGDAWDSANRALLYLTVFALFAVPRWRRAESAVVLGAFAVVTAVLGASEVIRGLTGDAAEVFSSGRLAGPIGYENASAALFGAAFWPAIVLLAQPSMRPVARGVLLATAGVLLELCVLAQSRGTLIAMTVGLVCAVALTRDGRRLIAALAAVGTVALVSLPALLAVFNNSPDQGGSALETAAAAIFVSALVLFAAGLASPRLDGFLSRASRARGVHLVWTAAAVGAVLAAGTLAASSRFTEGIESGRYDFWRVALLQVADHPLQGAGAGNFADDYARERHRHEQPLYPHSIVLGAFGQTGIVGGLLLIGFLGTALLSVTRVPVSVAAGTSAVAWLAHASLDWLWEVPAVTVPAMMCLGLVVSASAPAFEPRSRESSGAARAAAVLVVVAAAVSYALPALAAREIERAVRRWDRDRAGALHALDRARSLNPLTDRADLAGGALALRSGDLAQARRAYRRAAGRDGRSWYPQAALGVLDLMNGHRPDAVARLRAAQRLNPLEPAVAQALAVAELGGSLPPEVTTWLEDEAMPGPLGRRPVTCRPVLGLSAQCARRFG
jgi:tetratricopeptide (TPR) repeat protein